MRCGKFFESARCVFVHSSRISKFSRDAHTTPCCRRAGAAPDRHTEAPPRWRVRTARRATAPSVRQPARAARAALPIELHAIFFSSFPSSPAAARISLRRAVRNGARVAGPAARGPPRPAPHRAGTRDLNNAHNDPANNNKHLLAAHQILCRQRARATVRPARARRALRAPAPRPARSPTRMRRSVVYGR